MLKNKVALITGGTRGIGYATVVAFLNNGARVALCGSRQETVDNALAKLKTACPQGEYAGYDTNLTNEADVQALVNDVVKKWGKLDILINNAGISDSTPLSDYNLATFENVMNINLNTAFNCSMAAARVMKEQGGGVILNTSSVVSIYGQPGGVSYPTSKFAMNGMTKSMARELGKDGIRVNAVAPGVIETDMVAALPAETKAYLAQNIPLGRLGQSEDIANAFLYLASDMGSYVTGAILSVDGATQI